MIHANTMGNFVGGIEPGREDDSRQRDPRYADYNTCLHPDCETWIKNNAKVCKEHRHWYYALKTGNDFASRMRRHHFIKKLVASGKYTPVEAIRVAKLIKDVW